MMRPIMSSILRRTIRFSRISSPLSVALRQQQQQQQQQQQSSFYSSIPSSISFPTKLFLTQNPSKPSLFFPSRFASSSTAPAKLGADESLAKVIESEIECADELETRDQGHLIPEGFPFEIIDNPGEQTIILKREFAGESIQVEVHMPEMDGEDEQNDEGEDSDNEKDENPADININLLVTVSKGDGPHLEFGCVASPTDISIESMLMKGPEDSSPQNAYGGPEFLDLDENLQKSFHEYLEERGIKSSLMTFLQEYMMTKDNREYYAWLKNMKEFVEK